MVRTIFALILYFHLVAYIMLHSIFEISEDMVQILVMLEVLFTQDPKVEDLFCGGPSGSEPSLFSSLHLQLGALAYSR